MRLLDHPEARSMLSYLDQHPGEEHPALVFADWAEEHGFPAHAEVIRLHHNPSTSVDGSYGSLGGFRTNEVQRFRPHNTSYHDDQKGLSNLRLRIPVGPNRTVQFHTNLPSKQGGYLHQALFGEGAEPT